MIKADRSLASLELTSYTDKFEKENIEVGLESEAQRDKRQSCRRVRPTESCRKSAT